MSTEPNLLITADDRTGVLETGGACADLGFRVRFGPNPVAGDDCALLDIDSRHTSPRVAGERVVRAHSVSGAIPVPQNGLRVARQLGA